MAEEPKALSAKMDDLSAEIDAWEEKLKEQGLLPEPPTYTVVRHFRKNQVWQVYTIKDRKTTRVVPTYPYPKEGFPTQEAAMTFASLMELPNIRGMFDCILCGKPCHESFMVHNDVWWTAGFAKWGVCHLACLEKHLNRPLVLEDFPHDLPINAGIRFGYFMAKAPGFNLLPKS